MSEPYFPRWREVTPDERLSWPQTSVMGGLIAVAGAKIWVDNKVDFSQNKNLIVAAITLIIGTGDFTLKFGGFSLGGIGCATFGAILLYALLNRKN